jgi:hypothetical protein
MTYRLIWTGWRWWTPVELLAADDALDIEVIPDKLKLVFSQSSRDEVRKSIERLSELLSNVQHLCGD